jgi:hypothetical protein
MIHDIASVAAGGPPAATEILVIVRAGMHWRLLLDLLRGLAPLRRSRGMTHVAGHL